MYIWTKILASPTLKVETELRLSSVSVVNLANTLKGAGFFLVVHGSSVDILLNEPEKGLQNSRIHDLDFIVFEQRGAEGWVQNSRDCLACFPEITFSPLIDKKTNAIFGYQSNGCFDGSSVKFSITFYIRPLSKLI